MEEAPRKQLEKLGMLALCEEYCECALRSVFVSVRLQHVATYVCVYALRPPHSDLRSDVDCGLVSRVCSCLSFSA